MTVMLDRTDSEWVRQIKTDSEETIADLWEQLFVWAYALTRRYGQEEDLGRDATLAAFWRIRERGVHQYRFQGPFLGFCRRILVNELHRLMKPTPYLADIDDPAISHPRTYDPEPTADASTVRQRLQSCLDQLKTREREIITLLYFQELDPQAVADHLGIARNNANVIAFRSRKKLRDCLEHHGYRDSVDVLSM